MKTKIEITKNQIQNNNYNNKLTRGRKMKYFSIIFTVMVAALIGRAEEPQTGWSYDQSTQQAFYLLENVTIDGHEEKIGNFRIFLAFSAAPRIFSYIQYGLLARIPGTSGNW